MTPEPLDDDGPRMDVELVKMLFEHSPRVLIDRPHLMRDYDSPTGWVAVIPVPAVPAAPFSPFRPPQ